MSGARAWVARHRLVACLSGFAVVALLMGGPVFLMRMRQRDDSVIGGPFTLENAQGKIVTDRDFRGQWLLVYFGYTHCPDSCPTALNDIAAALRALGSRQRDVTPLFITVDPQRDTAPAMQHYADGFDKRIIALSGAPAQIAQAEKAYHVYAAQQPAKDGDYLVSHSSILYLMTPQGDYAAAFTQDSDPQTMAAMLKRLGV